MSNFKEVIQKIKSQYNIVDYIKTNGVNLEPSGNSTWKGLCPFHNEKTPSFTVSEDFQNYRCFGCGEAGDVITFAEKTHTVSPKEAIKMLAEEKGIQLDDTMSKEPSHDINGIRNVVKDAQLFYRANYEKLPISHPAKQEVLKRTLDVNNPIYGYSPEAPNELYKHLKSKGHSEKNIKDSNLVIFYDEPNRQPWDFFHGRLMITLSDYLGRPVSFTARKLYEDDKMAGKYVNGKESPIFLKKSNLFGADTAKKSARQEKLIYVVEGQFDKIAIEEKGIPNVVATSGTAFTIEHANLLLRMVGNSGKIIFIMDGDTAGIEAAIKIFTSSSVLHTSSQAVLLQNGKDPCDYIVEKGIEFLKTEIEKATPLHNFIVDVTLNKFGGSINMNNRQEFVKEIAAYAKFAKDSYVINGMLNKASVLTAISIVDIMQIYTSTEVAITQRVKKPEENVEPKLQPKIQLNASSEGDSCMFSAIALLVRMPDELIPKTPSQIHSKFKPFFRELGQRYNYYKSNGQPWRFIAEDYEDSDFAKLLQNKRFLFEPKEDVKSTIAQYEYLFERANQIYLKEHEDIRRAKALSSILDTTDPKRIAETLKLYKESHN